MGGCATKPNSLESEEAPAPIEAPAHLDAPTPVAAEKAETVPQENENEGETKKEEPLVDVSEPAAEAPKTEEVTSVEAKPATEEADASKPKESEVEAKEEKKEVAETAEAPKEAEVAAPKPEDVKAQ